jgi:hypothetical protein
MRDVIYVVLAGVGDERQRRVKALADFLLDVPGLIRPHEVIPPLPVLNSVLRHGVRDAGMSGACEWSPFELAAAEYDELRRVLSERGCRVLQAPPSIESWGDWHAWVLDDRYGVPFAEHRALSRAWEELEAARRQARDQGDAVAAERLYTETMEAGRRLSDFLDRHLRRR